MSIGGSDAHRSGNVLSFEGIDLDADAIQVVWDKSGVWIVADLQETNE